ncbi:hypothetical protein [Burkholderia guangdongensis]|uniref:hypothetical protein n=1 Tax=Burkholderia guangdongensis TaxID=1792500 RepID=UPI0015C99564|nr:hypothetical protein [Burkholderia guangdongensis]
MKRTLLALVLAGAGIAATGLAHADTYSVPPGQAAGWHGDRYWDGHRDWTRRDWEAHQRDLKHHCTPERHRHNEC